MITSESPLHSKTSLVWVDPLQLLDQNPHPEVVQGGRGRRWRGVKRRRDEAERRKRVGCSMRRVLERCWDSPGCGIQRIQASIHINTVYTVCIQDVYLQFGYSIIRANAKGCGTGCKIKRGTHIYMVYIFFASYRPNAFYMCTICCTDTEITQSE